MLTVRNNIFKKTTPPVFSTLEDPPHTRGRGNLVINVSLHSR